MSPPHSISKVHYFTQDNPLIVDFAWSFKPILLWMRLVMGIDLNRSINHSVDSRSPCCWMVCQSYGFLVLVYTISVNILTVIFMFESTSDDSLKEGEGGFNILTNITRSNLMILRITAFNEVAFNVFVYLVFYAAVLMKIWKPLWSILEQLQFQSPKLNCQFYQCCRKITLTGITCILVVI